MMNNYKFLQYTMTIDNMFTPERTAFLNFDFETFFCPKLLEFYDPKINSAL